MSKHKEKMKEVAAQDGLSLTDNEARTALFMIGIDADCDEAVDVDDNWYQFGLCELKILREEFPEDYESLIQNPPDPSMLRKKRKVDLIRTALT